MPLQLRSCLLVLALAIPSVVRADVKLPKLFGDSMVLQQQSQVAIWGWAEADEAVA